MGNVFCPEPQPNQSTLASSEVNYTHIQEESCQRERKGRNPSHMTIEELVRAVHFTEFPESLQQVVNKISIRTGAEPVGSSKYVACRYPGDIDCCETLVYPSATHAQAKVMLAERIQELIHRIQMTQSFFLADFKAGVDMLIFELRKYLLPKGYKFRTAGVPATWKKKAFLTELKIREEKKSIKADLCTKLRSAAEATPEELKGPQAKDAFLNLEHLISKSARLRWNSRSSIGSGEKILWHGGKKKLADALGEGTMVKMDIWAPFTDEHGYFKYTEVTNVFIVGYAHPLEGLGWITSPTEDMTSTDFADRDIRAYSAPGHVNYVKVLKRIWRKAEILMSQADNRGTQLEDACKRALVVIYAFFQGPCCALTQVRDESEVVRQLVGKFMTNKGVPEAVRCKVMKTVVDQLMGFKKRIKTAIANEALPFTTEAAASTIEVLKQDVKKGNAVTVPGYPNALDQLINAIWNHAAMAKWVTSGMVGAIDCTEEFVGLFSTNLQKMEDDLTNAINVGTKRWILANMEELKGVYTGLPELITT